MSTRLPLTFDLPTSISRLPMLFAVLFVFASGSRSWAGEGEVQSDQIEQALSSQYGNFSLKRDWISQSDCCSYSCRDQPGPRKSDCQSTTASGLGSLDRESNFRANFQAKPANSLARLPARTPDSQHPFAAGEPQNNSQLLTREMQEKVIDLIHPGFGRWEKTLGGTHLHVNYMNVKRCRGRDSGHEVVCMGVNFMASY